DVSLSAEDARKAGVDLQSLPVNGKAQTANGVVQAKQFLLPEITVEGFVLRNVPASCCVTGTSLLGMSALGQLGFEMKDGWMFLSRSTAPLLASPAPADKMVGNRLTPSEYQARVLTLDEKYDALRQQKENELAAFESRITGAREELARAREELAAPPKN